MTKKRFGISIDGELEEKIDYYKNKYQVTRSNIIEQAIKLHLNELEHLEKNHECTGIMVVIQEKNTKELEQTIEEHKDAIETVFHLHKKKKCIHILFINGNSNTVKEIKRKLAERKIPCKFVPLDYISE